MVDVLGGLTATSSLAFKILGWFPSLSSNCDSLLRGRHGQSLSRLSESRAQVSVG